MRTDLALNILKLILLGLLYLFFARVLWTVWQEVRTDRRVVPSHIANERSETRPAPVPKPPKAKKGRRGRVARLVILEPKARRGATFALSNEITIGRDPGCTIQIEADTFVSQRHARVFLVDGQPMVEDLGLDERLVPQRQPPQRLPAAAPRRPRPGRLHGDGGPVSSRRSPATQADAGRLHSLALARSQPTHSESPVTAALALGAGVRPGTDPPAERGQRPRRGQPLRGGRRHGRAQGRRGGERAHRRAVEAPPRRHHVVARRRAVGGRRRQRRDLHRGHRQHRPAGHGHHAHRSVRRHRGDRGRRQPRRRIDRRRRRDSASPSSTSATRAPTCSVTTGCAG